MQTALAILRRSVQDVRITEKSTVTPRDWKHLCKPSSTGFLIRTHFTPFIHIESIRIAKGNLKVELISILFTLSTPRKVFLSSLVEPDDEAAHWDVPDSTSLKEDLEICGVIGTKTVPKLIRSLKSMNRFILWLHSTSP